MIAKVSNVPPINNFLRTNQGTVVSSTSYTSSIDAQGKSFLPSCGASEQEKDMPARAHG